MITFAGLLLLYSSRAFHLSLLEDYCFISSGLLVIFEKCIYSLFYVFGGYSISLVVDSDVKNDEVSWFLIQEERTVPGGLLLGSLGLSMFIIYPSKGKQGLGRLLPVSVRLKD